jgi:hypothetical protein
MNADDMKQKAVEAAESVKKFNAKPPTWFYIVAGIVIVIFFQALRHI